jgi:hypothetical protein
MHSERRRACCNDFRADILPKTIRVHSNSFPTTFEPAKNVHILLTELHSTSLLSMLSPARPAERLPLADLLLQEARKEPKPPPTPGFQQRTPPVQVRKKGKASG